MDDDAPGGLLVREVPPCANGHSPGHLEVPDARDALAQVSDSVLFRVHADELPAGRARAAKSSRVSGMTARRSDVGMMQETLDRTRLRQAGAEPKPEEAGVPTEAPETAKGPVPKRTEPFMSDVA